MDLVALRPERALADGHAGGWPGGAFGDPAEPRRSVTVDVPRDDIGPIDARAEIEVLFSLHHAEILAFLTRMVRDPELAADMAQETFVKAYRAFPTLADREHARAWLYQIAHRIALDEFRRRRIVRFLPWTGESRGSAPSAEHLALEGRLSAQMERALLRVPERQRAALLLAELHDLTGLELADVLGVSHLAARAILTRARHSLRAALEAERSQSGEDDR